MIEFVPLTAEIALRLGEIEGIHAGNEITPDIAVDLEAVGGLAAVDGDEVVAIGGVLPRWDGCGLAWVWLGRRWRKHARAITNHAARHLLECGFARVEAGVRIDYERGHSWAARLGFVLETPLARKWGPDGADYALYSRVM